MHSSRLLPFEQQPVHSIWKHSKTTVKSGWQVRMAFNFISIQKHSGRSFYSDAFFWALPAWMSSENSSDRANIRLSRPQWKATRRNSHSKTHTVKDFDWKWRRWQQLLVRTGCCSKTKRSNCHEKNGINLLIFQKFRRLPKISKTLKPSRFNERRSAIRWNLFGYSKLLNHKCRLFSGLHSGLSRAF